MNMDKVLWQITRRDDISLWLIPNLFRKPYAVYETDGGIERRLIACTATLGGARRAALRAKRRLPYGLNRSVLETLR